MAARIETTTTSAVTTHVQRPRAGDRPTRPVTEPLAARGPPRPPCADAPAPARRALLGDARAWADPRGAHRSALTRDPFGRGVDRVTQPHRQVVVVGTRPPPARERRCPCGGAVPGRRPGRPARRPPRRRRSVGRGPAPVTPSLDRLVRPAGTTGDAAHAGRGGLEEHDAEALLLEARPSGRGTAWRTGRPSRRPRADRRRATRPRNRTGAVGRQPLQARPLTPATDDGERHVGPAELPDGLDQRVEALAGHQSADGDHEHAVGRAGRSRRRAASRALRRAGRTASVSTPGGTTTDGSVRPRGALGLGQRVAPGGDHQAGAAEHVAAGQVRCRAADPGTVTSAPCSTSP